MSGQRSVHSLWIAIGYLTGPAKEDPNYGESGKLPVTIHRKSKVWEAAHDDRKPVMHHWSYLELPSPLQRGKSYRLEFDENLNAGDKLKMFNYEMSLVAIAHKLTQDPAEKMLFEKGMYAEAEWTLGRNPLGLVQMTGLGERSITQTFAPGRRDGYKGVTPGWTPYMLRDNFSGATNEDIHMSVWYTKQSYPRDKETWPVGEQFWNSRYSVSNSETTPQQTFRQKIVL